MAVELEQTEQILIALSLVDPDYFIQISTNINEIDFLNPTNRKIFKTLLTMQMTNTNIDTVAVSNQLVDEKIFPTFAEAQDYLIKCSQALRLGETVELRTYINQIKDRNIKNKFRNLLDETRKDLNEKPISDINDYISSFDNKYQEISSKRRIADFVKMDTAIPQLVQSMYERLKEKETNKDFKYYLTGLSTGYEQLDKITSGFRKGEMIIIAARPSVGKTAFVLNLLYNISSKVPVGFYSLEMSNNAISKRLLQKGSGLTTRQLDELDYKYSYESNTIKPSDKKVDRQQSENFNKFNMGISQLSKKNIYLDDSSGSKISEIEMKAKQLKQRHPDLGLIAIDYLGLIQSDSNMKIENRTQQIGQLSRRLKALARTLDIPVIVLSQMSRESDKRTNHTPSMSDLRDSGDIEQDADIIMFLYREDYYQNDKKAENKEQNTFDDSDNLSIVQLKVQKNRNGRIGDCLFSFEKDTCNFQLMTTEFDDNTN